MEATSPASPPSWAHGLTMSDTEVQRLMEGTDSTTKAIIPTIIETADTIPLTMKAMYDARVPLGTNTMLWSTANALVAAITDLNVMKEADGARTALSMSNQPMFDLLAEVVFSGELFNDWPGWIRCVLQLLTRFIRIPEGALRVDNPLTRQFAEDFLQDAATTSEGVPLSQVLSSLLDQAWKHRRFLFHDDTMTWQSERLPTAPDAIRTALLLLLGSAIGLDQLKLTGNQNLTQLAFLCWFYEHGEHAEYADALLFALNKLAITTNAIGQNNDSLQTFFKHHVHVHYPPLDVCKRIRETVLRAKAIDENIGALCVLMTYFIADRRGNVIYILDSSLLQAMCSCVKLPLAEVKGPPNSSSVHIGYFFALRGVLRGIMSVMICVLREFPFSRGAEVIVKECDVPLLLSWIYRLAAFYEITPGPDIETHHYALFVNNTFAELAQSSEMRGESNPLRQIFVQSLRREWYPVLKLLRKNTTTLVREMYIHRAWGNLGKMMGLDEEAERKQFERRAGKLCSLIVCRFYTADPPSTLKTCAGCGEVKYHSKQCQTEDWKAGGHKSRCNRVK